MEDADPNRLADADQIGQVLGTDNPPATSVPGTPTVIVQTGAPAPVRRAPRAAQVKAPQIAAVERMFPQQDETVVVHRIRPDGPTEGSYIGTYAASELSGCVTIEQFLDKFVRPRLSDGYGAYTVKMLDATGVTKRQGRFTLERPASADSVSGNGRHRDPLLATAADLLRDLATNRGSVTQQQVEELKRLVAGGGQPIDANTRMILDRLDGIIRGPREENVERMLLTKLLKRVEELSDKPVQTSAPLPSLSAAPAVDAAQIAREVAREFADVIRQQQQQPAQMTMADVVALVEKMRPATAEQPNMLSQLTDVVTLMEKLGGGQRVSVLEAKLDKLYETVTQPQEQPSAIETIKQVVEVAESLETLGERRVSRSDGSFGGHVRALFQGIPDVAREVGTLVDKAKQREIATTRRLLLQRQVAMKPATPGQPQTQPAAQLPQVDPYPADFGAYIAAIVAADTDTARIKALFSASQRLGREDDWKPYYDQTVVLLRARNRKAIELADALLAGLVNTGRVSTDQRTAVIKAFERNFDTVADRLFPAPKSAD